MNFQKRVALIKAKTAEKDEKAKKKRQETKDRIRIINGEMREMTFEQKEVVTQKIEDFEEQRNVPHLSLSHLIENRGQFQR